jgi:purine-binding chemotaxis protein CheW
MITAGVSARPVTTTRSAGHWLMCRVSDRLLAVSLTCVVETMRPLPLRTFSGAPPFVLGVSVIRDAVVPVIGIESLLGVRGTRPARWVTVRSDDRILALAVDAVLGVRTLDEATLHDVPPLLGTLDHTVLSAIGTLDSGLLLVLGDARLVPETVWAGLDQGEFGPAQPGEAGSAGSTGSTGPAGPVTSS